MKKLLLTTSVALLISGNALADNVQYDLRIDGITCPFCVATSAKELRKIEGVKRVSSNLKKGIIKVCADEETILTDEQLTEMLKEKGFTYRGMKKKKKCDSK